MLVSDSSSEHSGKTFSSAFARRDRASSRMTRWLAGLPLIAVAAFAFNGPAPAEISSIAPIEPGLVQKEESRWSIDSARQLITLLEESAQEGLNPADYRVTELKSALDAGQRGASFEEASFNVVVGAPKTPTPQLALQAQSVVANPSWTLPPSVLKEGRWQGKGYSVTRRSDGSLNVRQAPGPSNALGRIKIDMPNAHAIYLHDTPQKAAFSRTNRALSHGCVRVQNIQELAAMLQDGIELDDALADPTRTKVLQLEKSVPVYIVYFTAEAQPDGTIRYLGDPYRRDQALLAQIGKPGPSAIRMASR